MDLQDMNAASERRDDCVPGGLPGPYGHARSCLHYGSTVAVLHGAIELSVPEVRAHTDAATARPGARVIVDLWPVEFLDCTALGLLCRARRRALERGGRLALVCVRPGTCGSSKPPVSANSPTPSPPSRTPCTATLNLPPAP